MDCMESAVGVCECRHPVEAHELVPGFDLEEVTIEGMTTVPDVWVCTGGRLVADPENASPWDFVCGCVRYHDNATTRWAA